MLEYQKNVIPDVKYFDVQRKDGEVVLKPLRVYDTELGHVCFARMGTPRSS
jgi:hypothetical protein